MTVSTDHIVTPTRVSVDTLSNFLKQKTEPIFAKDVIMGGLRAHKRLTFNEVGVDMDWPVRFKRRTIQAADGYNASIDSPATPTRRRAKLPWRRYRMSESYSKFEKLANRGSARLHDVVGDLSVECMDDFIVDYRTKLFGDGNSTGSKDLHGFESMFATSGLIDADAKCGAPTDVYGGMYCTLGYYGGSWNGDTSDYWPTGAGTVDYCFWSPLIVDTTNANWVGAAAFATTWQEAFGFAVAYQQMVQSEKFDFLLMNPARELAAKQSLLSTQRFELTQNSKLTEVGFRTLSWDGLEFMSQPNVPTGVCYMFQWDKITLRNMLKQLVDVEKDYDPNDSSDILYFDNYSNLQFDSPAYFAKIYDLS